MLKRITTLQWIGIVLLFNATLLGGASQLADLALSATAIKAILAVATLGNYFLGGLVTMFGGQGSMLQTVANFQGDDGRPALRVNVNANAGQAIASAALDPAQKNIGAASAAARDVLIETAKGA